MPHSSGGGSRSSGSFSGSSSSYSSSDLGTSGSTSLIRSRPTVSNEYMRGYHRYVYYPRGKPVYYYSGSPITRKDTRLSFGLLALCTLLIIIGIMLLIPVIRNRVYTPRKLALNYKDTSIKIIDSAELLSDKEKLELQQVFLAFQEKTGITPALLTVHHSEWEEHYSSFSHFAYESYVTLFSDERHWLLCYSQDDSPDFDNWLWEGMQGDKTDTILTKALTDSFTANVQKNLYNRTRYSIGDAFIEGVRNIMPKLMKSRFIPLQEEDIVFLVFSALFIGVPIWLILSNIKSVQTLKGKENAIRCPSDLGSVKEDACAYCGGIYVHGVHLNCPHCSAPISQTGP